MKRERRGRTPAWGLLATFFWFVVVGCKPHTAPGEVWVEPKPAADFSALDVRSNRPLRLADEQGRAVLLAFGYTSCADVCPTTLGNLHGVFSELGARAERVTALYVSVDPERDQPPVFADFMRHFDERIHGLSVAPEALGPLLKAYGAVAIKRPPNLRRYVGHDVDPNKDYSIDHSAGLWAIDPRGRLRVHYAYDTDPTVVARGLERLLDETPPPPAVEHARLVVHGRGTGAAYFTLQNRGKRSDRLLSAASPVARAVELHETVHDGDLVEMRHAEHGFELPPGATLELRPGGKHLMLSGVALAAGAHTAPLVLEFEQAGRLEVGLAVEGDGPPLAPPATRQVSVSATTTASDPAVSRQRKTLFVCADPNNMPFSNRAGQGFENRIAALVAQALGAEVAYTFWPQRRGFLRSTLNASRCDVVMGVPAGTERVLTTRPYYRSSYVFVYGPHTPHVRSFDAPELAKLHIGVPLVGDDGANPPPIIALTRRHLVANLRGYSVYGDYRDESPPSALIDAVRRGDVDLAVAWGPLAGYYAAHGEPQLAVATVPEAAPDAPERFAFSITMAVRPDDATLRDELDRVLVSERSRIDAVLREFAVPRL